VKRLVVRGWVLRHGRPQQYKLSSAILLSGFGVVAGLSGTIISVARGIDVFRRDSQPNKLFGDCLSTPVPEAAIVLGRATVIAVPLYHYTRMWVSSQITCNFRYPALGFRAQESTGWLEIDGLLLETLRVSEPGGRAGIMILRFRCASGNDQ